jgi:penicillin amidase
MGIPMTLPDATPELATFMNRGTENNLVRFGPDGVTIEDVTPPGQSGFIAPDGTAAPHAADQLALYEGYGRKRQWLTPAEVEANAVSTRHVPPR